MLCQLMNPKSRKTVFEEVIRVNLVTATAVVYEGILLGVGRNMKSGGIIASVVGIIIGILGFVYISREITRNEEKKRHMTKRINAVISYRERKDVGRSPYRYIYTFTGLDEYDGIIFYDESFLLTNVHVKGKIVTLLINEHNLEEFWFEEKLELDKVILLLPILVIIISLMNLPYTLLNWEKLPWN